MDRIEWSAYAAADLKGDKLRAEWDRLNDSGPNLPILDSDAVCIALDCFGTGRERLLMGRRGGATLAMGIFEQAGRFAWRTFQPSQMPLGCWIAAADASVQDLARSLARSGALPACLTLSLTQLDTLFNPVDADTPTERRSPYIDTAWIDIAGSFEDYWAQRGKNLRQNMKKQRNKLQTEGITVGMRTLTDAAEMEPAVLRYGQLEAGGWKARQGTAIEAGNVQGTFYSQLLGTAAARSQARVYEYYFGDALVASNLCLLRDGCLLILKTTYDESITGFSPAFLLHQDMLQALFEQGEARRIEYYGRVMEWHTRWTTQQRSLFHLTSFRFAWLKALALWRSRRAQAAPPPPPPPPPATAPEPVAAEKAAD
ncbi:MAG TPA: GNAT family N-acetyltransferase [Burkholderiaceae bacterium]